MKSRKMIRKEKGRKTRVSKVMTTVVILSMLSIGTFTWTSISQRALNEGGFNYDNPGGRIHDDYEGFGNLKGRNITPVEGEVNKDIYAENYSLADLYVRVKLVEYMEIGSGAGEYTPTAEKDAPYVMTPTADNEAKVPENSGLDAATLDDRSTWATYIPNDTTSAIRSFITLDLGDSNTTRKVYMPTFNQDNGDLSSDVTGDAIDELTWNTNIEFDTDEKALPGTQDEWTSGETYTGTLKTVDEVIPDTEHTATEVLEPTVTGGYMLMADWLKTKPTGNFWVYDSDGWAYWASPLKAKTATSLLLDQITVKSAEVGDPNYGEDFYYAIDVISEFVTDDELESSSPWQGTPDLDTLLTAIR